MKFFAYLAPAIFVLPGAASAAQLSARDFSVREIGPLLAPERSTCPVVGQGGNYSAALDDGRTVWFLNNIWTGEREEKGETALLGVVDGGVAVLESTDPWTAAGKLAYVADENRWPLALVAPPAAEYASVRKFWPRAGTRTEAGCFVFYSVMNNYGPQVYDHFRVGQGLAYAADPAGPYTPVKAHGRYSLWNDIEPAFGSALWADRDGWTYVYGRVMTEPGAHSAALARVKPEDLADLAGYSYYTRESSSAAWTGDVSEATPVLENMPDEFSVSYNEHLKKYIALYSGPDGGARLRAADYPWGPWGEAVQVLACRKEEYCYGAKEQAAFAAAGGRKVFFTLEKKNAPRLYELVFR